MIRFRCVVQCRLPCRVDPCAHSKLVNIIFMRCLDYFYARIKRPRNAQLFLGYEGWLAWLELRGMGKERGGGRIEVEKEVCGSATPKVVSAWSFDGGGGATTPLMLSHPLSRRFSISICIYLHIPSLSLLLPPSSPSLCRFSLASFLRSRGEGGIVLVEGSTFHVRRPLCTFL